MNAQTLDYPVGFSPAYDSHREVIQTMNLKELRPYKDWCELQNSVGFIGEIMLRERHLTEIGFPILTKEVARLLARALQNKRVVEVGCGTGFLSQVLSNLNVEVTALDSFETKYARGTFADRQLCIVQQVNATEYDISNFDAVVMSWPDYNSDFAYKISKRMRVGQYLIYEGEDCGGCTADYEFFNELDKNFQHFKHLSEKLNDFHSQFNGIHDWWHIYRKQSGV